MPTDNQYAQRDIVQLDEDGDYYIRHVSAMTAEGLHAKSDIAAELGWRDREIARLREALTDLANAIDDFGVRNLDTDDEPDDVIDLKTATLQARAALESGNG